MKKYIMNEWLNRILRWMDSWTSPNEIVAYSHIHPDKTRACCNDHYVTTSPSPPPPEWLTHGDHPPHLVRLIAVDLYVSIAVLEQAHLTNQNIVDIEKPVFFVWLIVIQDQVYFIRGNSQNSTKSSFVLQGNSIYDILHKRLGKQSRGWWFQTPYDVTVMDLFQITTKHSKARTMGIILCIYSMLKVTTTTLMKVENITWKS